MENLGELDEQIVCPPTGRKRTRNPESYPRNIAKKARHSGEGKIPVIRCAHNIPGVCLAPTLTDKDLSYMHNCLYSTDDKVKQDATLLLFMDVDTPKRRRKKVEDEEKQKSRNFTVKYFVKKENQQEVPVCKESFMGIFNVKKSRLASIARHWFDHGVPLPENRGGARNVEINAAKRKLIQDHIQTFPCRTWHGAPGMKYLSPDLNVKKMHNLFKQQHDEQIPYSYYYSVFMSDFNLGFGDPSNKKSDQTDKSNEFIKQSKSYDFMKLINELGVSALIREHNDHIVAVGTDRQQDVEESDDIRQQNLVVNDVKQGNLKETGVEED